MLVDEVYNRPRKSVFLCQRHAIFDMSDYDEGAKSGLKRIVTILSRLVLDEILRLQHLADVVKIAAHACQKRISANRLGSRLRERRNSHAVRVRPRRAADELLQQRM